ncbi:RAD57 (YDR004W) [Zygosaccharomyces parabailii]|nr:RAD57 (YDR004W) [Zygosaccharomyces parabailii]CDH10339.1 related to DNA repair protein RAD57 [Zygosaccharomyces bailii ISA1307]
MDLYDELPQSPLLCEDEFLPLLETCKRFQVSVVDFLTLPPKELARQLQRSINEVTKFQELLISQFEEHLSRCSQIKSFDEEDVPVPFTTTDVSIDEALGGGIFTHSITEIFGESSSGKSQFLMQLCLSVQLPLNMGGFRAKCVYITTEGDLPTQRLESMLLAREELSRHGVSQKNVYTVSCCDLINQEHILNVQLPILLEQNKGAIKLVIIDSISHHMRVELPTRDYKDYQDNKFYIDNMAEKLLDLAHRHSLAVVVANQVSDKPLQESLEPSVSEMTHYEYQLGWLVGWKNSSILHRQRYNGPKSQHNSGLPNYEVYFSEDEDNKLINDEVARVEKLCKTKNSGLSSNNLLQHLKRPAEHEVSKTHSFDDQMFKKRKIDQRVPNLGLSWASHLSTRILLSKSYKASPMIRRSELHLYSGKDPSAFWQVRRIFKIVFSSYAEPKEIPFVITKRGVESVSDHI